ncbi:ead/Ea22-like family protein [Enterobacter hormaechei]|uniref:ead/Ea22-like family protein n=1 Tax=Enterobacter hormaechei TaxID=158836 RepID=UPI001C642A01|nr:ead/Ea22-like family protein [Enterobacter hormaechei]MBW7684637.1 ead/Ea22-like family protein [Enterobacter hormaechei]
MSSIDKRALREAAEKAGSDKWQAKKINGDFYVIRNGSYEKQHGFTSYQPIAEIEHKPVRDFVAAANPATVLALLDELEAAEKRIAELEAREVKLPERYEVDICPTPSPDGDWYSRDDVLAALVSAGVRYAEAAGKGE